MSLLRSERSLSRMPDNELPTKSIFAPSPLHSKHKSRHLIIGVCPCHFVSFLVARKLRSALCVGQVALSPVRNSVGAKEFSSHTGLGAKRPTDWRPPSPAHIFKDGYFNNDCSAMHL